jgi:hypothetical protein
MLRRDMIKRGTDVLSLHIRELHPCLKVMGKSIKNHLEDMDNSMEVNLRTMVDNLHMGMTDAMSAGIKTNAICRDIVFYILIFNAYMYCQILGLVHTTSGFQTSIISEISDFHARRQRQRRLSQETIFAADSREILSMA